MPFVGTLLCHHTPEPDPIVLMDRVPLAAALQRGGQRCSPRSARQLWEMAAEPDRFDALPTVAPPTPSSVAGPVMPSWLADCPPFDEFAAAEIVHEADTRRFVIQIDLLLLPHAGTLRAVPTLFALPVGRYVLRVAPWIMAARAAEGFDPGPCEFHPDWERGRYALVPCR